MEPKLRKLILFGPPGVGKGEQATRLKHAFHFAHLSTGEILREEIKNETELGLKVKRAVESGEFVDDDTVIGIIVNQIDRPEFAIGFILDGFPRNLNQARRLDEILAERGNKIDCALSISAPDEVTVERLSGRRICAKCSATYHVVNKKPKVDGVCDLCEGKVILRKDDAPQKQEERLKAYFEQTKPLADYYRAAGTLKDINGDQSIDEVSAEISEWLCNPGTNGA